LRHEKNPVIEGKIFCATRKHHVILSGAKDLKSRNCFVLEILRRLRGSG